MFNKKILCLGNNSTDTDTKTTELADQDSTVNLGLIADQNFIPTQAGYYHTTIIDIPAGGLLELARQFDTIVFLDQPQSEWTHWKPLLSTYKIMLELEHTGCHTVFKNNNNIKKYQYFDRLLTNNKSFCIYPWINMVESYGYLTACARSDKKITTVSKLSNWKTDPEYQKIRTSMLLGEKLPEHCRVCYDYEKHNIESYRQFETKEWISKLDINSVDDLNKISNPYYYEIRLSNKCNLKCRSCRPEFSHLIEQEFKQFNIIHPDIQTFKYSSLDIVDIDSLSKDTRIYLTGGEPTVMTEVLYFMEKCIDLGKVDFDFTLGTNGVKLTPKFLRLCSSFTNMNFSISLDGFGKINDYWRSGSVWENIIKNMHTLVSQGHNISINCVPGIYNVTNLHLLFEFLDKEFPGISVYLQLNSIDMQSAFNHPNSNLVIESMEKCKQTRVYHSDGKSNKTAIDSLHSYYSNNPVCNISNLQKFFAYNDRLDQIRGVQLADFIPELEACRPYTVDL